jgi:hypothetical protein
LNPDLLKLCWQTSASRLCGERPYARLAVSQVPTLMRLSTITPDALLFPVLCRDGHACSGAFTEGNGMHGSIVKLLVVPGRRRNDRTTEGERSRYAVVFQLRCSQ